jgi:hypothetical protein
MNGVADRIEREIPIRVNAMMGADAIMGKAERKILAAAHAQITGTTLGDADATESEVEIRDVTPTKTTPTAKTPIIDPFEEAKKTTPPAGEVTIADEDQPWGNEAPAAAKQETII